ncbi:MAG TPA: TetR family transcriptional regulator [Acidimicrobiales bacterium]
MTGQVGFENEVSAPGGLRDRKKLKTRLAIEDAALELFSEKGFEATTVDDIAERAEVSTTTFFRYFPNKADVILTEQIERLPSLRQSIIDQPGSDSEIEALRNAIQQEWVGHIDPVRTARTTKAISSSRLLRGLGHEIGHTWQIAVSEALARRRGLRKVDARAWLAATMALSVFGDSVKSWADSGCRGDLGKAVDRGFDTLQSLCDDWASSPDR